MKVISKTYAEPNNYIILRILKSCNGREKVIDYAKSFITAKEIAIRKANADKNNYYSIHELGHECWQIIDY